MNVRLSANEALLMLGTVRGGRSDKERLKRDRERTAS